MDKTDSNGNLLWAIFYDLSVAATIDGTLNKVWAEPERSPCVMIVTGSRQHEIYNKLLKLRI